MKTLLLILVLLALISCATGKKITNTVVESEGVKYQIIKDGDNQTVITESIIDSCEYDIIFVGKITCNHKDNCKFCQLKNRNWRER